MNAINTVEQLARLKFALSNFKFHSDFADGLEYNDPIYGKFNEDAPEIILTIKDDNSQAFRHLVVNGFSCTQRGVNRYKGNTFTNGTSTDIHILVSEDWELHHDIAKLTGLKLKLA